MDDLSPTAAQFCILCVDPDRQWLNIMKRELSAAGIREVLDDIDPKEALITIREENPDLLITNHNIKLVHFIRHGSASPNRKLPVIMVTAQLSEDDVTDMRDAGVNEIVAKPCSIAQLLKRIETIASRPREFVETDTFVGPTRRRKQNPISGPDRRGTD